MTNSKGVRGTAPIPDTDLRSQIEGVLVDGKSLVRGKLWPRLMKGGVYGYEISYNDLPLLAQALTNLIQERDTKLKEALLGAVGDDEPINWHNKPNATYAVINEESEPAHFRNELRAETRTAINKVLGGDK